MGLRTRFPLFTGMIILAIIWILLVGRRTTGAMSSIIDKNTANQDTQITAKALETMQDMEKRLRDRERQLDDLEKALRRDEKLATDAKLPESKKSLISYVYTESESNRRNLQFFVQHGLYASADFVFSFNGETDAHEMLPNHPNSPWYDPSVKNIEVIQRENKCYDFGAHGEAMLREWDETGTHLTEMTDEDRGGQKFWQKYSRFILMNASIRGPFLPYWSQECWAEAFFNKVTEKTKLVGMSYNCHGELGHVQSMVWATDRIGIEILMAKPPAGIGYWCPIDFTDAIYGETRTTPTFHAAGYDVDAMTAVYHSHDGDDLDGDGHKDLRPDGYLENCSDEDFFHENAYYGFNIHPYETIFMKAARKMNELLLGNLTVWADGSGYSSYEFCDKH